MFTGATSDNCTHISLFLSPKVINQANVELYYRPQRSWGKVIFPQACVILFTGGVCLSACWDTTPSGTDTPEQTPWEQTPPCPLGADTPPTPRADPPGADTPLVQSMLGDTVNARAVRILLECNFV